jgi:hypothetical protein
LDHNEAQDQAKPSFDGAGARNHNATRTMIWIGIAGLSAALAFTVVRSMMTRRPGDPTSQRIQQLIDEANTLLKTLDDKKTN